VTSGQACLIDLVGLRIGAAWTRHGGLTPAFASPEARGGAPADPRDDVYSLAAMLFQLLAGELVNPGRATNGSALPPAGLTSSQWRVLQGALDPNRERRVKSTTALVDAMWPVSIEPHRAADRCQLPPRTTGRSVPALAAGVCSRGSSVHGYRADRRAGPSVLGGEI
jgi:serine/threonine protein kinase